MISILAKGVVLVFGSYLIIVAFFMLFQPEKIREILRKAGSTDLINYSELVLRMVVGLSFVCAADISKTEIFFQILGWFM